MCDAYIAQIVSYMEDGGHPLPYMFRDRDCQGPSYGSDPLVISDQYNRVTHRTDLCNGVDKASCPIPYIQSLVMPPNLKIEFHANIENVGAPLHRTVEAYVKEIGQLNLYSDSKGMVNGMMTDLTSNPVFTWNSSQCPNKGEENCSQNDTGACLFNTGSPYDHSGQLLHSMISCNSPFYPSFMGINVARPDESDTMWSQCKQMTVQPTYFEFHSDYCSQGGSRSIEASQYATLWSPPTDIKPAPCSGVKEHWQACSCFASPVQVRASETPATATEFIFKQDYVGGPRTCSSIIHVAVSEPKVVETCQCKDMAALDGSVDHFTISLVDDDHNPITWDALQAHYCAHGVNVAGFPIKRYQNGSPSCDAIMRKVCVNTASLTLSGDLLESCGCIMEERRLKAQFAGIDLPIQCFTTVCDINNDQVYKTSEQVEGCSARVCRQTIDVHGTAIMAQGFQQLICHGEVYQITEANQDLPIVPLVSQVTAESSSINLGPIFYVAIGLMLVMLLISVIWGIRRGREVKRQKVKKQQEIEGVLLQTIHPTK